MQFWKISYSTTLQTKRSKDCTIPNKQPNPKVPIRERESQKTHPKLQDLN